MLSERNHFNRFLDAIDDYLYGEGWYINGRCIRQKCKTFEEVEKYLFEHCYSKIESRGIVSKLRLQTYE